MILAKILEEISLDPSKIEMLPSFHAPYKKACKEHQPIDQFKMMIVSIEGHKDPSIISKFVDNMPTLDSRHLKACYKVAAPDVKVKHDFECNSCGYQQEMEVPFNTDFFWPDR
jgi:hypothetical protein